VASTKDIAEAVNVKDVTEANSVKDVVLFKRSKEPLLLKLEAGSMDLVALPKTMQLMLCNLSCNGLTVQL